eukprot:Seg9841.1 transcript_id=Seg9841.1/GoldUCD/mRNA.D3Y31 product="hypothetical protein" protein_id=Seg9841.1/GoldUCD/D3Y31
MEEILKKKKLRTVLREYVTKLITRVEDAAKDKHVEVRKMKQFGMQLNARMETVNKMDDDILVLLNDEDANACEKETKEVGIFQERVNIALLLIEECTKMSSKKTFINMQRYQPVK